MSYSVWIYGPKVGWWLQEEGYEDLKDALASLGDLVAARPEWTGGAVVPGGRDQVLTQKQGRDRFGYTIAMP